MYIRRGMLLDSGEVFTYYANDIYRFLLSLSKDHYLTEDLLQETFYRAHINIHKLDSDNIKSWLFKVAHNLFIDHLRKNKQIIFAEDKKAFKTTQISSENVEREVLTKVNIERLESQIDLLPINQRHAIILSDINDLSYKECADILGISIANFKSRLYRARQKLRKSNEVIFNEKK